jgi:hypothetical protein
LKLLSPKALLHLEGLAVLAGSILLYRHLGGSWLLFTLLFLVPDLAMAGYAAGPKTGAACYNLFHTYTLPLALSATAYFMGAHVLLCICVIWIAHIGFDRMLGYGLKYGSGFKDTHLGKV